MTLTALDVASGVPVGPVPLKVNASRRSPHGDSSGFRAALEAAVRPALRRPPCFVAFSGGRDSSVLLAIADRLAAREGLGRPVALSARFTSAPETDESAWQERGIAALGVKDWERLTLSAEDVEGLAPSMVDALRRHGLLYPPNLGLSLALLARAGRGSLITGFGGDELLGAWRHRWPAEVLTCRRPLGSASLRGLLRPLVPRSALRERAARHPSRSGARVAPWLSPDAAHDHARLLAAELAEEPHAWGPRVRWKAQRRRLALMREALDRIAADARTLIVHPLLDPRAVEALARAGGRLGFGDRTATMRAVFGGLVPDDLLARPTKASFDEVFWGPATRAFARRALDEDELALSNLLDRRRLAEAWTSARPPAVSLLLLQASWLKAGDVLG